MIRLMGLLLTLLLGTLAQMALAANTQVPAPETVQTAWRLLDYLAVDYPGAVKEGRVISASEYGEMREFSATVEKHLENLPQKPERAALISQSRDLRTAIAQKAAPERIALLARSLGSALLRAYPVPMAPAGAPDTARGGMLYAENCAACHGATGDGKGPAAAKLNPPPIAFKDKDRADQRSIFALDQVITQGLDGTPMASFAHLPADDRWALAFHVGSLSFSRAEVQEGERIWVSEPRLHSRFPNLETLVSVTPAGLASEIGEKKARAVLAYLRTNPSAVAAGGGGSLSLTRQRLSESLAAYRSGNGAEAKRLALSAYLDGFEPLEPAVSARDDGLKSSIEEAMAEFRAKIGSGKSVPEVEAQAATLDQLFARAEQALSGDRTSDVSAFISSLTILVREGLEALLVVVAMIAFLRKAERSEVLPYVHAGWVTALLAGAATWFVATELISISGAGRELTEGFGGIFAALVLVSVGIWMHGKSKADAWQRYIKEKLDKALSRGSAWFLFGLAFVVVYREVFETILFFAAMSNGAGAHAIIGGALGGAAILGVIAWAMLQYSSRLPITAFFRYSSALIAVLAVVLAGKGIAAIQEAGLLNISPLASVPRIDLLGIYPSIQSIGAQLLIAAALGLGFWFNGRGQKA
ncbi:MAG: iron permease [Alphaproteobacteria bacterium]|nr:iron permease [Alphaproteobacteria bacterium]